MWRILASILFAAILIAGPVRAEPLPKRYVTAEKAFNALPIGERIRQQLWLTAAGHWLWSPSGVASEKLLDAIGRFQKSLGNKPTGILSREEIDRLRQAAAPTLSYWGLQKFTEPQRGYQVWIPVGLGLKLESDKDGLLFTAVDDKARIQINNYSELYDINNCNRISGIYRKESWNYRIITKNNQECVIAARLGSVGNFYLAWPDAKGMMALFGHADATDERLHLERLLLLMHASLWWSEFASVLPPQPAQSAPDQRYFDEAKRTFEALDADSRRLAAVLLIASGHNVNVTPAGQFTNKLFAAIGQFQAASGLPPTGILRRAERELLVSAVSPYLSYWKLSKVALPGSAAFMWAPLGLGKVSKADERGWRFESDAEFLEVALTKTASVNIKRGAELISKDIAKGKFEILYKNVTDSGFYIFSRRGARDANFWAYVDGDGFVMAFFSYDRGTSATSFDNLQLMMVESLFASLPDGYPLPLPTDEALERFKSATPGQVSAPAAEERPKPAGKESEASSGTGIFVTGDGKVLTNAHVIEACRSITVSGGGIAQAVVLARDTVNDLALLRTGLRAPQVARLRTGLRLGEPIAAFGYPLAGLLSTSGNFTLGNVTALSGVGDDSRFVQISAPIQPGNSGGPLVDASGNLVGVVSEKLNALQMMLATKGNVPENVAFAIKGSVVAAFLESNDIAIQAGAPAAALPPVDLADVTGGMGVYVQCN